jgi:hypothetical protein
VPGASLFMSMILTMTMTTMTATSFGACRLLS